MDGRPTEMIPDYSAGHEGWTKGNAYQDWVVSVWPLCYPGKTLTLRNSRIGQWDGETDEGVEIKFDDKIYTYCPTGRLYIELEEKVKQDNDSYVLSGIYRQDNSKYYLIGDYIEWWIFAKQTLVDLDKKNPDYLYRPKPTGTSIGYCLPVEYAMQLSLRYQQFDEDRKPRDDTWLEGL